MNAPGRAAFAVCILAAWAGMAAAPGHAAIDYAARRERRTAVAVATRPPAGCALGTSGPTLDPGHAVRRARRDALRNLALQTLGVHIRSETRVRGFASVQTTTQHAQGLVADAHMAALWLGETRVRQRIRREVFALACSRKAGVALDLTRQLGPAPRGRTCALGVAGPTLDSEHQRVSALHDARRALAEVLESRVFVEIHDDGRGAAWIAAELRPTTAARSRAQRVEAMEAVWLDGDGRGPLRVPGVLYGRICESERGTAPHTNPALIE